MNADDLAWGSVTPRRCRHLREWRTSTEDGGWSCRCGHTPDPAKIRRGRLAAARGKRIQREKITALGGRNLAGNNPNLDGLGVLFAYEWKSGSIFPERLWRYLKGVKLTSGQYQVLGVTDTPGVGYRSRSIVVMDYDDFRELYGELKPPVGEDAA